MADVTLDTLEKTLPREYYLDDALYQREFAAIFHCDWVCIGAHGLERHCISEIFPGFVLNPDDDDTGDYDRYLAYFFP